MTSKEDLEHLKQRIICAKGEEEFNLFYKKYYEEIENALEVLEIIKNKLVFPLALMSLPYELYNNSVIQEQKLTREEYDKVKEYFKKEV